MFEIIAACMAKSHCQPYTKDNNWWDMKHTLHVVRDLSVRRVIKQFAAKNNLVYFGLVDPKDYEHQLIRGVTASTTHTDGHYTVGTFEGRDMALVMRRNTLSFPGKPDSSYQWLIAQVDLRRGGWPHTFIDANHHDEVFYSNLAIGFAHLQDMSGVFNALAPQAHVFTAPSNYQLLHQLFNPELALIIRMHLHHFDYEINDDQLLVYSRAQLVTPQLLGDMLKAGVWLADQLDSAAKAK